MTPENLSKPEPAPKPNDKPAVWDLVVHDMKERDLEGMRRYGTPLQPFNGRRPLRDAYQEALDLVVYLRQEIAEADERGETEERLEVRIVELERDLAKAQQSVDYIRELFATPGLAAPTFEEAIRRLGFDRAALNAARVEIERTRERIAELERENNCLRAACGFIPLSIREAISVGDVAKCDAWAKEGDAFLATIQAQREELRDRVKELEALDHGRLTDQAQDERDSARVMVKQLEAKLREEQQLGAQRARDIQTATNRLLELERERQERHSDAEMHAKGLEALFASELAELRGAAAGDMDLSRPPDVLQKQFDQLARRLNLRRIEERLVEIGPRPDLPGLAMERERLLAQKRVVIAVPLNEEPAR